ncbi:hypothetical protein A9958_13390 (plasmid) [Staphylococcus simulans]|nr:hypothetical protein [Staphylococcus simulans]AVO03423.1 hypothetical protein BI282_13385 [Staphylococcus simulans]AVO06314.1 hypothetical protein BI283_12995 [Staphylococcus simulans]AWG19971.1 hypothetical protein A9958_13390 [Staphylococcus simulans]AWI02855.1 hypothetical protein A7X73_12925 [Staphylococcus simulans]
MLEDLNKAKWNFITLAIAILSYVYLSNLSDKFIGKFGKKVQLSNLFVEGYLSSTMQILGLIFITIVLFCITIFIAWQLLSITSIVQMIISVVFICLTFSLGAVPFFGTLLLLIIVGALLVFLANES